MQQANDVSACHRKAQAELPSDRIRRQHLIQIRKLAFDSHFPHTLHMDVLQPRRIYRCLDIVQSPSQSRKENFAYPSRNDCLLVQFKEQAISRIGVKGWYCLAGMLLQIVWIDWIDVRTLYLPCAVRAARMGKVRSLLAFGCGTLSFQH